jgi:hypothetical protein
MATMRGTGTCAEHPRSATRSTHQGVDDAVSVLQDTHQLKSSNIQSDLSDPVLTKSALLQLPASFGTQHCAFSHQTFWWSAKHMKSEAQGIST